MVDFVAARAFTLATTASVFDTTACTMKPMAAPSGGRDVNARRAADTGRAEFDFMATLDLEPSNDSIPRHLGADPGSEGKLIAYDAVITALTVNWPYLPKRLDRVAVADQTFEIMLVREDGSPRRAYYVNRVK